MSEDKYDPWGMTEQGNDPRSRDGELETLSLRPNRLKQLSKRYGNITVKGLKCMTERAHNWRGLVCLELGHNKLGKGALLHFSRAVFASLEYVGLLRNQLENTELMHLSKAVVPFLKVMVLDGNYHTDEGLKFLSRLWTSNMQSVSLGNSRVTCGGAGTACLVANDTSQAGQGLKKRGIKVSLSDYNLTEWERDYISRVCDDLKQKKG